MRFKKRDDAAEEMFLRLKNYLPAQRKKMCAEIMCGPESRQRKEA